MIILIGRLFYLLLWILLAVNLIYPFPYPSNIIFYIAIAALILSHGIQAILLSATLTPQEKKSDPFKIIRFFFFGFFEALSWNKSKNKT